MIFVSVNSSDTNCEINISCRTMEVYLVKYLSMRKDSHWRTVYIFLSILKGTMILLMRRIFLPFTGGTH